MCIRDSWFTILIEGHSGRGSPRQEYMDKIKERRYVVIKRLCWEGKELQALQLLSWGGEEEKEEDVPPVPLSGTATVH